MIKRLAIHSISFKLTLAFLVVSLTGIALVALLVWGITASEFSQFVTARGLIEFNTAVTNYYKTTGSWEGVTEALQKQGLVPPVITGGGNGTSTVRDQGNVTGLTPFWKPNDNPNDLHPASFILIDQNSYVIIPFGPLHAGEQLSTQGFQQREAIKVNNQVVGYVVVTGKVPIPSPSEARFLAKTNQALILAALGAAALAVLLGLLLARTITRPLRDLTVAARALAAGSLSQTVPVRSKDELGELTKTFNKMSADLERSKQLRRQMTADIAHDLRTPLAVITGYLEGLKDGIVRPTVPRFTAMYDEARHLQRLVDDLRLLSLADAGELSMNCQPTQPGEVLERLAAAFQHQAEQKQIQFETVIEEALPSIQIDPERMQQALSNLVSNAMRYTPAGGAITLSARRMDGVLQIDVQDSGAGIDLETLPHVFERFYRGDDSRQDGGTGLGLAIAKSIVELQMGKISASSPGAGKGSLFSIQIPVAGNAL